MRMHQMKPLTSNTTYIRWKSASLLCLPRPNSLPPWSMDLSNKRWRDFEAPKGKGIRLYPGRMFPFNTFTSLHPPHNLIRHFVLIIRILTALSIKTANQEGDRRQLPRKQWKCVRPFWRSNKQNTAAHKLTGLIASKGCPTVFSKQGLGFNSKTSENECHSLRGTASIASAASFANKHQRKMAWNVLLH